MDGARVAVAIMAKAPKPGEVKTRLCPPLSLEEAAGLYDCFLRDKVADALRRHAVEHSGGPARDAGAGARRRAPGRVLAGVVRRRHRRGPRAIDRLARGS